ncbi:MAG: ABC transporter substrate-binding protein [Pseudomonadota bacterium]
MRVSVIFALLFCTPLWATAEPRVIEHRWGTTTVEGSPERVVSLSFIGHDFLLGLGVKPVALRFWYGDGPFGVWSWAVEALGDAEPDVIYGQIDVEAIALLEPDLITAQWSGITETEYRLLSRIAPTLPPARGETDFSSSWQVMTRQLGLALGKEATAEAGIRALEARFAALRSVYPDWQGKTAVTVWPGNMGAYKSLDLRGRFLEDLGFQVPAAIDALAGANAFYVRPSMEDLTPIDTDLLVWLHAPSAGDLIKAVPLRPTLSAYREGREVYFDNDLTAAISHSSPLALHYALDRVEPMIAAAIDGDPSTVVESAADIGILPE